MSLSLERILATRKTLGSEDLQLAIVMATSEVEVTNNTNVWHLAKAQMDVVSDMAA